MFSRRRRLAVGGRRSGRSAPPAIERKLDRRGSGGARAALAEKHAGDVRRASSSTRSGIEAIDLTGAWLLRALERRVADAGHRVQWAGERPEQLAFIERTERDGGVETPAAREAPWGLQRIVQGLGERAVLAKESTLDFVGFVGAVTAGYGRIVGSAKRLRLTSVVRHVYETGLTAVPIVALIAFLISVIVAYIGAQQLRKFGGEIFVVDLVTVSVLRELGVLLTAIIVAGRSGSAFAAEIGAMKLNEEVDALRAIGMDPVEVLVLPRIFGLVIALPALTVVADAMGLAGGALLSWYLVDIPLSQYIERVQGAIGETTFWVGIIKAPVFAVLIALVGTLRGMQVRDLLARARPADDERGGAVDLPRDPGRRGVRGDLHGARHLMDPVISVRGIVNRFGRQVVHDGLDVEIRRGRGVRHRRRFGQRQVGAAADPARPAEAGERLGAHRGARSHRPVGARAARRSSGATASCSSAARCFPRFPSRRTSSCRSSSISASGPGCCASSPCCGSAWSGCRKTRPLKFPSQLSGGMTKRAALARALALDPAILFLDEPTSGLDPISAAEFDRLVLELQKGLALTVVMITHDLDTIYRVCNRVGVIVDGKMISGTLDEIVRNDHPWIRDYFHGERSRASRGLAGNNG